MAKTLAFTPQTVSLLRVAVLTTSFPLSDDSVSGVFIQRLVQQLSHYVEISVITPDTAQPVSEQHNTGYKLLRFRYAPRNWQLLAHQPGGIPMALATNRVLLLLLPMFLLSMFFASLRISKRVDLIHANWSINGIIAGVAGLLTKTPIVTTLRGSDVARAKRRLIDRYWLRLSGRLSTRLITVGTGLKDTVSIQCPFLAEKISVIPNGVGDEFLDVFRKRLKNNNSILHLTSISNLISEKGVDDIVKAFSHLDDRSNIELTIIGDGPERQNLRLLCESLNLSKEIRFIGKVPPTLIASYLTRTDIFIAPSYSEGRPNTVLEAMAAGIPVIGTNIDGIKELIQHAVSGLLFPPGDTEQLARHITHLRNSAELRKRYGEAGRKFIINNGLTWEKAAKRYVDIYEEVVHNF